ncbi:MAG: branched-chain amino acid transport system II carrier protein [Chlamydiales bacterium 38-26]|nr:branched-chain amino acid transport system II carrier protein [Chlamydiales bacterium]OJV07831.1 MAG: branched-chain amino acid transport system II carrier protein [Chlamydiales bacterium 38-26]
MKINSSTNTVATGLAMFSMFFGAGNVVFPLGLGQYAQNHNLYAILGILITAVGVPFAGLIAMTLFNGDYKKFFERIGVTPGFLVITIILGLIGPFGAIPRCIVLSYATLKPYLSESFTLPWFSILSCIVIFIFTIRRNNIIDVLGYVLTPILLITLAIIIIKGILLSPPLEPSVHSKLDVFIKGIKEGYQTMDLLAAFFFSSVVISCLKKDIDTTDAQNYKKVIFLSLKASVIGAFLLSIVYVGFSFVAAFHSQSLIGISQGELPGAIALHVLGPYAASIAHLAVILACLTTVIALTAVFADFTHQDIFRSKLNYGWSLILTLTIAFFVSTLNFTGIANFLSPILQVCYPALIMLCFVNILYKLYHFSWVKTPVFITFIFSLIFYLTSQ